MGGPKQQSISQPTDTAYGILPLMTTKLRAGL
jgi:hypothetical protein